MDKNKSLEELLAEIRAEAPKKPANEPIEPPKAVEPPRPIDQPKPVEDTNPKEDKAGQKPKKAKEKKAIKMPNIKLNISKKAKKIIISAVAIIVAVVVAVVSINFALTAYLRPYEKKYHIDFPRGIAEELCDAYGKNQNVIGSLQDGDTVVYLSNFADVSNTHEEKGSDLDKDFQLNAVVLKGEKWNIEKSYATAEDYVKSSQKVVYTDFYGKTKTYKVVAAYYTNVMPADDDGYVFPYNTSGTLTEDSFGELEDKISSRQLYKTGFDMSYDSNYLTISVDTDFMPNYRFCILCQEVKPKKFEKTTKTTPNNKIHYPQSWYDKTGEHNPYWLAGDWSPIFVD